LNTPAPRLKNRWNDASGGLGYHWRALKYRHRHWGAFHAQVRHWLNEWHPDARTLILVGPSGGYALDADFLSRFDRRIVLEPDPVARWLLRRRFRSLRWEFAREDVFHDPAALDRLTAIWPDAAILFCNVIGQLFSADELHQWLAGHDIWFRSHAWASWHDVFSSSVPPLRLPDAAECNRDLDDGANVARALWAGIRCEVEDHGTFGWQSCTRFALWPLTPVQWHMIGWVAHPAAP